MKKLLALVAFLLVLPAAAEEITVDKVLAAQSFGVSAEAILAKVNDPANTVAVLTPADVDRLRVAGVPEGVVAALQAKAPKPEPPAAAAKHRPDNPKAEVLVKAVQAGTSEALIVDQLMKSGVLARPTLNDLIYFKENKVPEGIIRALMEAPIVAEAGAAGAKALVPNEIEVDGLVRKTGFTSKNRPGKLTMKKDKIEWLDGLSQADAFEMFPAGMKAVRAACLAKPEGKFCHEVVFEMAKGSDFTFIDAKMDVGGNESIRKLLEGVKLLYPKMPVVEKVK
jgi:hypothetical protein